MVKKDFFRLSAVACILVALAVLSSTAPTAHAATKPQCAVTEVTLHGTAAPTVECKARVMTQSVHPNAGVDAVCTTNDLVLYWNGPIGVHPNYVLCIRDYGLLNLNQLLETNPNLDYRNWNDQASAWWTGCDGVWFYADINRGGASYYEPGSVNGASSPSGTFPLGGIGNDRLSSVYVVYGGICGG